MGRIRGVVTMLLLLAFAGVGSIAITTALVVAAAASGSTGFIADLVVGVGVEAAGLALLLTAPPAVALALRPRRAYAASVVATLYGLLVVGLTASKALNESSMLLAHLAGLLLVFCAFPLSEPDAPVTPPTGLGR